MSVCAKTTPEPRTPLLTVATAHRGGTGGDGYSTPAAGATSRSALPGGAAAEKASAQALPEAVYDLVAACVPTRERLTVLERVCGGWRRASRAGHGWKHDVDLSWADPAAAATSSLRARLVWLHCVKRLVITTQLFYEWFGVYKAGGTVSTAAASPETPVASDSSPVMSESTPAAAIHAAPTALHTTSIAQGTDAQRVRPWSACEELALHDNTSRASLDDRDAVSNAVFPAVTTLKIWVTRPPLQGASLWAPAWPSLRVVIAACGADDGSNNVFWHLRHLPNLTYLSMADHTLVVEDSEGYWPPGAPWEPLPLATLILGESGATNLAVLLAAAGATLRALTVPDLSSLWAEEIREHCSALSSLEFGLRTDEAAQVLPTVARLTSLEHLSIRRVRSSGTCEVAALRSLVQLTSLQCGPDVCTPAQLESLVSHLTAVGSLVSVNGGPVGASSTPPLAVE